MTSFASILDGLSNTAFLGEKALHPQRVGHAGTDGKHQDGPLYFGKGAIGKDRDAVVNPGPLAFWARRLGEDKADVPTLSTQPKTDDPNNRFGSWHPGLTLFLLGDGAVREVSHKASNEVLGRLGCRNDLLTFDLPPITPEERQGAPEERQGSSAQAELLQPTSRSIREVEGWTVRVDDKLLGEAPEAALGARALRFLAAKLVEIKAVVSAERLKDLQAVTIVLDFRCGKLGAMQYHPDAGWLKAHGYPADLAKCVHLPRAADLPTRRNINEQPWVILHELAHAYHDQQLGFDEPRIKAAHERFKQSGRGDAALLYNGKRVKHYGLTDHKEFFAEMTESYFGVNDFFPFNRAELQEAEPEVFQLLTEIWTSAAKRPL